MTDTEKTLPPERLWQPTTVKWFAVVFGSAILYSVIRYHIAGDVPWSQFPLFILNKATSLAAVIFVACSYLIGKIIRWHDDNKALRLVVIKFCGLMGFFLACAHAFFSLLLWSPAYFAKYFAVDGKVNLYGELGMTAGVVALFFLLAPAITTLPMMPKAIGGWRWKRSQRAGYTALALVGIHLLALGLKGWLTPGAWPAGLVPISLIAFVVAVLPIFVKRKVVHDKEQRASEREKEARQADE
jgi:DMSO/TMAO reductase YedYZ heme-binding membrane subunit